MRWGIASLILSTTMAVSIAAFYIRKTCYRFRVPEGCPLTPLFHVAVVLVLNTIPIWVTSLTFRISVAQASTSSVKQGATMNRKVGNNFRIPPASIYSLGAVANLVLIIFYDKRIGIGMGFSVLAMTVAAFVESKGLKIKSEVRSSVPWGPFTGYASILKRSRFLKPAQRILDEFCGTLYFDSSGSQVDSFCENPVVRDFIAFSDRIERSWKTSKLVLMLEEVYWKYKLYCQQMQSVVASFETVAGLGHAAPYISFAFKAISKHFCCLKNAILDQIHVSGSKTVSDKNANNDTTEPGCSSHKPVQKLGFLRPPHWRSQRALPDHAVAVLKTWLYENFLHPYPTDSDKQILAKQTGLSKNQVSNWFINARVRLWKPMVEEVHMLEIGQTQTTAEATNSNFGVPSDHLNTLFPEKLYQATQILQAEHVPTKHCRNKRAQAPEQNEEQKNACLSNLPSDQHIGFSGSSGVTLALALNQNDGNDLSRPFP
ncbi:hypothetical protein CICLE_v10033544mg, partial [Citrus x clementina]